MVAALVSGEAGETVAPGDRVAEGDRGPWPERRRYRAGRSVAAVAEDNGLPPGGGDIDPCTRSPAGSGQREGRPSDAVLVGVIPSYGVRPGAIPPDGV